MPTLNRFPLLGLWAKEGARRLGYSKDEAESLGHAYAVLYAIRARGQPKKTEKEKPPPRKKPSARVKQLHFGGDDLPVIREDSKVRGLVGHERPQTPASYEASVEAKFPAGYYEKLAKAFRALLKQYPPSQLNTRLLYDLYDEWKRQCGVGRRVDLDELVRWCRERAEAEAKG